MLVAFGGVDGAELELGDALGRVPAAHELDELELAPAPAPAPAG